MAFFFVADINMFSESRLYPKSIFVYIFHLLNKLHQNSPKTVLSTKMYMPNLVPRDVHHLWLQPNEKPSRNKVPDQARAGIHRRNQEEHSEQNQRQRSLYAPPLSAYSSERPGASLPSRDSSSAGSDQNDIILNDIESRIRELRSIRTLGYSYLAPLGIGKTMRTLNEEMDIKRQMDEQYQTEAPTAENLLGEGDNAQEGDDAESTDAIYNGDLESGREVPVDEQGETQATEQVDLDDEIPEAEENSYDHIYDQASEDEIVYEGQQAYERQYDQGFMVSEEYQEEENISEPQTTRSGYTRDQLMTPEQGFVNRRNPNTSLASSRPNVSFSSSFSNSNIQHDTFNDSTHPGEISVNESDLDMVIDDD